MTLLTPSEADRFLVQPLEMGLCKELMKTSVKAKKEQTTKVFGCRHCFQSVAPVFQAIGTPPTAPGVNVPPVGAPPNVPAANAPLVAAAIGFATHQNAQKEKLRDFNALRSHLKAL